MIFFMQAIIEPVLEIRKEGIEKALVYLRPPVAEVETKENKIAAWLQKHKVTKEDIDNYQTTSSYILQKILRAAGITYAQKILDNRSIKISAHMSGDTIISDTKVARLRELVTEKISQQKVYQQYSQDEIKKHIDDIFRELDDALRVERLARDLHLHSHLLDKVWMKRISAVIAKRKKTFSTPLRYNTTWQQIAAYDKSSREIFLEITYTVHAGGWPLLFGKTNIRVLVSRFMRGENTIADKSIQKLTSVIRRTIVEKPAPTNVTKQVTLEKLKTLLAEIKTTTRVERALLEMQADINDFDTIQQHHIRQAITVRDEHLLFNRFHISWGDVQAYTVSSVTVIKELITALRVSMAKVSRHAEFDSSVLGEHLSGETNLGDNIATKTSHTFCSIIATADLPPATAAELRAKAINLLKLIRIERATGKILQDHKLAASLTYEQKEALRKVQVIKEEAIRARARAKTTQSR